jgi:hypothetical protein
MFGTMISERRKLIRVCAKWRRRIRKHGVEPYKLNLENKWQLHDYAYVLMRQLEEIEEGFTPRSVPH